MLILYLNVFTELVMCFGMSILLLKYFLFVIFVIFFGCAHYGKIHKYYSNIKESFILHNFRFSL